MNLNCSSLTAGLLGDCRPRGRNNLSCLSDCFDRPQLQFSPGIINSSAASDPQKLTAAFEISDDFGFKLITNTLDYQVMIISSLHYQLLVLNKKDVKGRGFATDLLHTRVVCLSHLFVMSVLSWRTFNSARKLVVVVGLKKW